MDPLMGPSMTAHLSRDFFAVSAWALQNFIYLPVRFYFKRIKRLRILRDNEIVKLSKPLIVAAAPHLTHLDVVVIPAALPRHQLPVRWLADRKIFSNPVSALWFKLWGAIPVSRGHDGSFHPEDIDWILEFALQGHCIGLFPECCLVGHQFGRHHQHIICQAIQKRIQVIPAALLNLASEDAEIASATPRFSRLPKNRISQQPTRPQVIISKPLESCQDLLDSLAV